MSNQTDHYNYGGGQLYAISLMHPDARYVAMDEDGEAFLYKAKPCPIDDFWGKRHAIANTPGLDNYAPNWRESLVDLQEVMG